jgi:hypothetical protein
MTGKKVVVIQNIVPPVQKQHDRTARPVFAAGIKPAMRNIIDGAVPCPRAGKMEKVRGGEFQLGRIQAGGKKIRALQQAQGGVQVKLVFTEAGHADGGKMDGRAIKPLAGSRVHQAMADLLGIVFKAISLYHKWKV